MNENAFTCVAVSLLCAGAFGQSPAESDPHGIVIKPIPDKLVVLTFDDGCASHATVVAPILKSFGFGGSFYVCDFDSFRTRKDWYLTWRQMQAMAADGFEIGNHTTGHAGGSGIAGFLSLEDALLANNVPKPTTVAWPVFQVNTGTYPQLAANGYIFGRGGHFRPYRPTVDNPFDVPCMGGGTVEEFVSSVRQATGGKVVVICFHGVPDMEHPACSLDPAVFRAMMQYLKDNNYKAIALRDLSAYIDPARAAKLPPTRPEFKESGAPVLAREDKPCLAPHKDMPGMTAPAAENKTPSRAAQDVPADSVAAVTGSSPARVFKWNSAAAGHWSDSSCWSNQLAAASAPDVGGRQDYRLEFDKPGRFTVTNDLSEGFVLNQLSFSGPAVNVAGKGLAFVANGAGSAPPRIDQNAPREATIAAPVALATDVTVSVARSGDLTLGGLVSGTGSLTKNGDGRLRITHVKNTFRGGTVIDRGSLYLYVADAGLGSGPITLNGDASLDLEHVNGANPLILNGGTINAGNGFGDSWNGAITLNGDTRITSYADFVLRGRMAGPGGFTQVGSVGGFGLVNGGQVTLCGTNTYTGATIVRLGTLRVLKALSLYHADPASWTPARITVAPAATLRLCVGGPGEFTGAQIGALIENLTTAVKANGLMARSVLCLDTAGAGEPVTVSAHVADSRGFGGGAFVLRKCGVGTLRLSGDNTYTGPTILEGGTLSVASLNNVVNGQASSSLGAPTDVEAGEIVMGSGDGACSLVYTGAGETCDRVINLAGKASTVTFDQSGTGPLKLTSAFVISGYGANKTVVLKGDTAGTGEMAGNIVNPYDRAGIATTALAKAGSGAWTLSGKNSYTGPTTVTQGTLSLANVRSLGPATDVSVSDGAILELRFKGEMRVGKLTLGGKLQPAGAYCAAGSPAFITGTGVLKCL